MMVPRSAPSSESKYGLRILVAERSHMASQLLAQTLARYEIISVATSQDLFSMVSTRQPQLALISADLDSEVKKGFQVARNLHSRHPAIQIVMLLEKGNRESVTAAFRCGAAGVFCRTDPLHELFTCIEHVARARFGWVGTIRDFC